MLRLELSNFTIINFISSEGEDCEIQFGETVLLPVADAYRRDRPDYDPNFDDLDDMLQFYIALDVGFNIKSFIFFYELSNFEFKFFVYLKILKIFAMHVFLSLIELEIKIPRKIIWRAQLNPWNDNGDCKCSFDNRLFNGHL